MVLTDTGVNKAAEVFTSFLTKGQWGTGTADPSVSNTGLGSAIPDTLNGIGTAQSGNGFQCTHTTSTTEGNDYDLTEYELQFSDGTNFNRLVSAAIGKTNNIRITTITTVNIVRV